MPSDFEENILSTEANAMNDITNDNNNTSTVTQKKFTEGTCWKIKNLLNLFVILYQCHQTQRKIF